MEVSYLSAFCRKISKDAQFKFLAYMKYAFKGQLPGMNPKMPDLNAAAKSTQSRLIKYLEMKSEGEEVNPPFFIWMMVYWILSFCLIPNHEDLNSMFYKPLLDCAIIFLELVLYFPSAKTAHVKKALSFPEMAFRLF